jgi:hypothetical protein
MFSYCAYPISFCLLLVTLEPVLVPNTLPLENDPVRGEYFLHHSYLLICAGSMTYPPCPYIYNFLSMLGIFFKTKWCVMSQKIMILVIRYDLEIWDLFYGFIIALLIFKSDVLVCLAGNY